MNLRPDQPIKALLFFSITANLQMPYSSYLSMQSLIYFLDSDLFWTGLLPKDLCTIWLESSLKSTSTSFSLNSLRTSLSVSIKIDFLLILFDFKGFVRACNIQNIHLQTTTSTYKRI